MRNRFQLTLVGQEVQQTELNLVAQEAAEAEDRVIAALCRPRPFDGTTTYKGILPYGRRDSDGTGAPTRHVVDTSGTTNHSLVIAPFRVVVGTRDNFASSPELAMCDVRSQLVAATGADGTQTFQLPATVSNNRWDLIYVRVDINVNAGTSTRYVKAADGTQNTQSVALYKVVAASIGSVLGTEGASPTRPTIPSDTADSFYVPLAYALNLHPETLTTTIDRARIVAAAPILQVPSALGGVDARPASCLDGVSASTIIPVASWTTGKPQAFLPADMVGYNIRYFGLDFTAGTPTIPLNTNTVLDDSIDWRQRIFKCTVQTIKNGKLAWGGAAASSNLAVPGVAFSSGNDPGGLNQTNIFTFMGQSFVNDATGNPTYNGYVLYLNTSNCPRNDANSSGTSDLAASSFVRIFVTNQGKLSAQVSSTNPNCVIAVWLEASGQFRGGAGTAY